MVEFFPPGKVAKSVFRVGKVVRKGFKFVKYGRKYLNSIGSALESGLKADVDGTLIKFSKNGDEVAQISGGTMVVSKHSIPTKDGSFVFKKADDVNSDYPTGWEPPYAYNSPVTEFITSQNEQFVRVFSEGVTDQQGRWIMKKSDIEGLSASQIKDRFAIPMDGLPNRIVDVSIPSGIKLRTGKAASTSGGNGGGIQFEIPHPDPFASNWFTNIRILP